MDNANPNNKCSNNNIVSSGGGAYDEQRRQLDKLMSEPDKPVHIPGPAKERKPRQPREFIRNIWGSSAGVGSGDFHIYRGIRRRQMEREEYMEKKCKTETLDSEYAEKQKSLNEKSEEKTAKKRQKRQKKKMNKNTKIDVKEKKPAQGHKSDRNEEDSEKAANVPTETANSE